MYTIEDVKNIVFTRAGRGYNTDEVDEFIEEVVSTMEAMQKNSDALMQKLGVLADKIEEYRAQENSIHSALLTAQRMADQVMKEAQANADKLKEESESKATKLESEARQKADVLTQQAEQDYQTKLADTKQQATRVIAEAKDRSGRMLFEALEKSRAERAALEEMKRQNQRFKTELIAMYQEQIALIERLSSQEQVVSAPSAVLEQPEPERKEDPVEIATKAPLEESVVARPSIDIPSQEVVEEIAEPELSSAQVAQTDVQVAEPPAFEPAEASPTTVTKVPGTSPERFQIDIDLEEERPSKFSNLKFGDDYDIADDEDYLEKEPSRGFFKKKKNKN